MQFVTKFSIFLVKVNQKDENTAESSFSFFIKINNFALYYYKNFIFIFLLIAYGFIWYNCYRCFNANAKAQGRQHLGGENLKDIIVVYPKKETALSIRSMIEKSGFRVTHVCALGSSALEIAQEKQSGAIVCPFVMRDITAAELAEQVPQGFDIIALSKSGSEQYMGNLITLPVPMDRNDFLNTVQMLACSKSSFTRRTGAEDEYISKAKEALISLKGMSETQAHKFLQQESMKSGKKIAVVAMDILDRLT